MWKRDWDDETRATLTAEHPQRVTKDGRGPTDCAGKKRERESCGIMEKEENRVERKFKEQRFHHANNRLQAFAPSFSRFQCFAAFMQW